MSDAEANVTNLPEAPHEPCRIRRTGEELGLVAMLGAGAGLHRLRVQHEILVKGRRSSSPHAHTTREEVFYVLSGTPRLWLDGRIVELRPGDCVVVPAGTGQAHTLINDSGRDAELLTIATQEDGDRCFYPLNPTPGDVPPEVVQLWRTRSLGPHDGRPERPVPSKPPRARKRTPR
jgi:uncharacterized cupin superfamily protein